jgi:hypothetical protein
MQHRPYDVAVGSSLDYSVIRASHVFPQVLQQVYTADIFTQRRSATIALSDKHSILEVNMKTKFFAGLLVVAMLLASVGVAVAAPVEVKAGQIAGNVTAINGNTLTVQTLKQGEVKVQTDANTRFHMKDNPQASLADVKVGDLITARGKRTNAVLHANVVVIIPANLRDLVAGKVQAISGSTIVITKKDGSTVNVATSANTKFHSPNKPAATLADVKVGDLLEAAGVLSGNTLDAGQVRFHSPRQPTGPIAFGLINSVSGKTLTLDSGLTVNFSDSTLIVKRGPDGATVGSATDLVKGAPIMVIGLRSADGKSMNAVAIVIGKGK